MFDQLIQRIPPILGDRSGKVFYSGRQAFSAQSPLYVLGLNPGGNPEEERHAMETVAEHTEAVRNTYPAEWSAYRDESWRGRPAGTYGMQPRVLYAFHQLGLLPEEVPCSNLFFARSQHEGDLNAELDQLVNLCWPFHERVLHLLQPRAILCFGQIAGDHVLRRLGRREQCGSFEERNKRKWCSRVFATSAGTKVIVATHPSRANWMNPLSDPTALFESALQ